MNTAIAGFIGAIIGAGASLLGLIIQQYFQTKRERVKLAADLGAKDFSIAIERAKQISSEQNIDMDIPPLSAYVIYHLNILEEMYNKRITPETILRLSKNHEAIFNAFDGAPETTNENQEVQKK